MKTLTIAILSVEYQDWIAQFKEGRNKDGIRFGQYLWCTYNLDTLFPNRDAGTDGFNTENASKAFTIILNQLQKQL